MKAVHRRAWLFLGAWLALWPGNSGAEAGGKRLILRPKAGMSSARGDAALRLLGRRGLDFKKVSSAAKNGARFTAWIVEIPPGGLTPEADRERDRERGAAGFAASAGDSDARVLLQDDFLIEADIRVKWIESAAPSLPGFDSVAAGLRLVELRASLAPRELIPWGVRRVNAPAAWPATQGEGVKVAVVDTGIDTRNPDLDGRVLGGVNAITGESKEADYQDDNGHGTHVAGTIAATRGNSWGVVGVAPQAVLYAVKVLDADGSGHLSGLVSGIVWCINNKMQVVNMSLGSPIQSEALHEAVQFASGMGLVIVAASGNTGGATNYPAAYPEVISVSAAASDDALAVFSSRGKVEFIAPGVDVVSLAPMRQTLSLSGTSMAAPHVTGLAALAVSLGARGLSGPDGVLAALRQAAVPLEGLDASAQGAGMIDAAKLGP